MRWRRRSRLMLVTGGSGFLGRHVLAAAGAADWQLYAPSSHQLDVTNRAAVSSEIGAWRPDVVVHLAYRREQRTIVAGTANVADAARRAGSRLIHLSTDLVFAGRPRPYTEDDAPDAGDDYGRWKAEAEHAAGGGLIVRTSLLYGDMALGHCQRDVQAALDGRLPAVFYTDEFRCPAFAGDVAAAIVTLAGRSHLSGPLHIAGPEAISRYQLARRFATWMGYDPDALVPGSGAATGRPGTVQLDSSAAAELGIRCRPIGDVLA